MEKANIITIGWTGILSSTPPRTYISVRPQRYSHAILKEGMEFVINLAPVSLAEAVDFCGIYTGAKLDKFERTGLTKKESLKVSPPTIAECPVALECKVYEVVSMGTHDVFLADIVSVSCDESILDKDGRMRFDKADLLAYCHGEYFSLGRKIGSFGFSTKKGKKKTEKNTAERKPSDGKQAKAGARSEKKKPRRAVARKSKRS